MWKVLFSVVIVLIAALGSSALGADNAIAGGWQAETEIDTSRPLDLDQCISIALEQSSSIRLANLNLTLAKLDVDDAKSNYWPEIGVSGQYRFTDEIDFGWERQNYDAQIAANYTIWDHGKRKAGLAQSRANQVGVQSDYKKAEQDLIHNITVAYFDMLQAERLIDINQLLLEISNGNVNKVIAFMEADRAIPSDVAAARVQQANDELSLINAQNNLELARAGLASRMGIDPRTPINIVSMDEASGLPGIREIELGAAIEKAILNRPELDRLRSREISLQWSLKLARLDRWPVLSANCDYTVLLDDYLRDREDFKNYSNWSASMRVTFPIFDGGASKRREQNAEIAIQQFKEDMTDRERSIMLEVQQAYLGLERAKKRLDIAGEQVKNATESLNVTQARYEQGLVIFLEVLSAQSQYSQALTNQVTAFYDYKIAEKAMLKAMGALKVED